MASAKVEWRVETDYRGLNEVTPPMTAAMLDMLELQYELESKVAKWGTTNDIANAFFLIPLAAECRPQFAFTWRGVQYTWNRLPQGWKQPHHLPWANPGCTGTGRGERPYLESLAESTRRHSRLTPGVLESGIPRIRGHYTPTEKETLAAYEGVRATSEVVGTEAQLLLAPRLPVLGWMFKGRVPSMHHATGAMWSKWVTLVTQWAQTGNPNCPGILEVIIDWPEGKDNISMCHLLWRYPEIFATRRVIETAEGEGELSQFVEVKAIQLALGIVD
ncbi:hypothetical protein GRJ2_000080800 [Grus japonensis]|uniref:ribonuclease H n=1 Tax=Grus japonensis TaxID=30415 RepID=A0ABC9VRS1_GRUJA